MLTGLLVSLADAQANPPEAGLYWFQADLLVETEGDIDPHLDALIIETGIGSFRGELDFQPIRLPESDAEVATWIYPDVLMPAQLGLEDSPQFRVEGSSDVGWRLEAPVWISPDELAPGRLKDVIPRIYEDSGSFFLEVRLSRSTDARFAASNFKLIRQASGSKPASAMHLAAERVDSRTVHLFPLSGSPDPGSYELLFSSTETDRAGMPFEPDWREISVDSPPDSSGGASLAGASLASTIALVLEESPVGSGLLSASTSGTFANLGRDYIKSFEVELESGDQLSAYVNLINPSSRYRFRVVDATDTELFGGFWGNYYPPQRLEIPVAGTYRVQVYVDLATTDFDLRIDVGRGLFLEAENNDTPGASNLLTFEPASGGYQENAAGALSDLPYNYSSQWPGSNDVNGDYFDLGTLSAGNSMDVTFQFPDNSSLASGDLELAIFAEGSGTPTAISTLPTGLSTTIPADGRYFLRVAANDNLDGTSLYFDGGTDRVDLDPAAIDGLNSFTLEFWARGQTDQRALISGANGSQYNEVLVWFENATTLRYYDRGSIYSWTVPAMDEVTWRHFAVVRDGVGGTIELFVDGLSQGSQAGQSTPISITHLMLGQEQDSAGGSFDPNQAHIGHIDDFRIWETLRTPAEIDANQKTVLSGSETGLRAYYRFNEGTGTLTADETANNFDGTLVGPVFDGDVNAAGFNPASLGILAQYYATVTIIDSVPPEVVSTSLPTGTDDGYYTSFDVTFSEDLDPETVQLAVHYDLRASGEDGLFDTPDDKVYTIVPETYIAGTVITLFLPDGPLQPGDYRFQAASGIEDRAGTALVPYEQTFTLVPLGDFIIESRDNDSFLTATSLGPVTSPAHNGSFTEFSSLPVTNPYWAAAIDLNGDPYPDLLIISDASYELLVYLNNGDGTFTPGNAYALTDNSYEAVLVDLDGDTDEDVAVAVRDDDEVRIFFNNGDGTLTVGPVLSSGDGPRGIAAGDMDGNGMADLITANEYDSTLTYFANTANGAAFSATSLPQVGADPHRLLVGDFDADPALDVVFTDFSGSRIGFLSGVGDGSFSPVVFTEVDPLQSNAFDVDSADLDGDGHADLVVAYNGGSTTDYATILYGNSDGTFSGPVRFFTDGARTEIVIADINDDGIQDVLAGNNYGFNYYLGTGDRLDPFYDRVFYSADDDCYGIAVADFDQDGRTDFVITEPNDDNFYLFTGNPTERPLADATVAGFYQALGRGNLRDADDVDWYRFTAQAGERLVLVSENANTSDSNAGLRYEIFRPEINSAFYDFSDRTGGRMQTPPYTFPYDGTYYLRVQRNYDYFKEYRFRLTIAPPEYQLESENNYRTLDADPITFDQTAGQRTASVLGQLMPGDTSGDYYALGNLASGTDIDLSWFNTEDSSADPKLWIYSRSGSTDTVEAEETQGTSTLSFTTVTDGTYFARVTTLPEDLDFFSEYRLEITLTDSDPPAILSDTLPAEGSTTDDLLIAFTLNFNEDLAAASVTDPVSYELRGAGVDNLFNTADDFLVPLGNLDYTAGLSELYTIAANPLQPGMYRFTAFSGGLEDLFGNTLPTDYVREFTVTGLPGYITESTDNDTFETADPLTTNPPGPLSGSFSNTISSIASDNPQGLRLVDVDNDGQPDVVISSATDDRLSVYFGTGDGTFTTGPDYPIGDEVYFAHKVDLDGDGDLDIALSERGTTDGLRLFQNNADGTLTDLGLIAGGVLSSGIDSADLDGVNGIDLVMANLGDNSNNGSISIFIQQPDESFVHSLFLDGLGLRVRDVKIGLVDNDAIPDLVFGDFVTRRMGVCIGNGDGTFQAPVYYPTADFETGLMTGEDFDDDGDFDIVVGHQNHNQTSLFLNNGDGTFAPYTELSLGNNRAIRLETHDLNEDGYPDLIQTGDFGIGWRFGMPGGEILSGPLYFTDPSGNDLRDLDVADVNSDGILDIVTVGWNSDNLLVYFGDARFDLEQTPGFAELFEVFGRGRDVIAENNSDYYVFSAKAGQKVLIDAETDISAFASHTFYLYDSFGNQLFGNTLYYAYEQFPPVTLPRDGNYYLRIIGNNGHDDIYRFRVSLVDNATQPESEGNNAYNQADILSFSEAPGIREARVFATSPAAEDDEDWFSIGNLAENAQVTVTFSQPADSSLVPTLSLRANNGTDIRIEGAAGNNQIVYTLNAGQEDFHYIRVGLGGQTFAGRYFLDVAIEDLQAPEITSVSLPGEGVTTSTFYVDFQVSFSEDLQSEGVTDSASYILTNAGPDNIFGTADDFTYDLLPQGYTSGLSVSLIIDDEPLQPGLHRFTIPASALRDLFDNPLASDFVREFTIEGVVPYLGESLDNETIQHADTVSTNPNSVHDGSFLLGASWTTALEPRDILALDVDDDLDLDVLVAGGNSTVDLQLFINNGDGTFAAPITVLSAAYPDQPADLAGADFNNDGRLDVVLSVQTVNSATSDRVVWLLNNGDGTLTEIHADATLDDPGKLETADLNDDGWADVVAVERSGTPSELSIFLNDTVGGFARSTFSDLGTGADPRGLAVGDFDSDGHLDIVVTDYANQSLVRLQGTGDGTFTRTGSTSLNTANPLHVQSADLDGDGLLDVAVTFNSSSTIDILRGNTDLTFEAPVALGMRNSEYASELLVGDVTGDGLPDVVVGTHRYDGFTIFSGQRGSGYFLSGPQVFEEPTYVAGIESGDFDGDGLGDLLIADFTGDYFALYPGTGGMPLAVDSSVVGLRYGMARGTSRNGDNSTDVDYWTFTARAGDRVVIVSENTASPFWTDAYYQIFSPGGDQLVTYYGAHYGGEAQTPPFTLDYSGRVYLSVSDSNTDGEEYRLNVNLVPAPAQVESENNDNSGEADAPVFTTTPGKQEAVMFGAVDRDDTNGDHFFLGNLDGGTSIQVRLTLPDNSLLDPRLQIYRNGDPPLAETSTSIAALDATVPVDAPGPYYARIDGTSTTRGFRGTYLVTLTLLDTVPPEIISTDLPDSDSSAIFSNISLELNEDFDPVTVNDPAAFDLREAGLDGVFDTGDDILVPIGDPAYAGGSTITLPLPDNPLPAGEYRFTAFATLKDNYGTNLPADFVQSFTMVSLPGFVTESVGNDSPLTATLLPLDPVLDGILSKGGRGRLTNGTEEDYWVFSATSGQRLVLASDHPGSPNFSGLQLLVTAPDGTTAVIDHPTDRDGDFATSGLVPLTQTGDYILRVDRGTDSYTGEYNFRVTLVEASTDWEVEPNDSNANASTMTLYSNPDGLTGDFIGVVSSATDRDYVSLGTVSPGNTIFLSAAASVNGPLVPVVSVYRADAVTGDDVFVSEVPSGRNGDGVVEIDVTEEHEYFALIRGSSGTGSLMSEYQLSVQMLPTDLANFPNLQVSDVTLPGGGGILSGDNIAFSFTVDNVGADPTAVSAWIDRAVISTNNIFGDGDDYQLAVENREAPLAAGGSYTVSTNADLPDGISGAFFIIVRTDTGDQVDEFLFEGDNELASSGTFNVALADYPDLVVENLVIPEPTETGDLTITWDTVNRGDGATVDPFIERVELIDRITGGVVYASSDVISSSLPIDGTVSRSLPLNGLPPANYRVRIDTDFSDDYYEFGASGHSPAEENLTTGDFIVFRFFEVATFSSPVDGGSTSGGGLIKEGSSVTVTATPDTGLKPYSFVRWKSAAGSLLTTDPVYNFVPTANIDLIAEFELPLFTVSTTRNLEAGGTVSGAGGFRWGSVIPVQARPNPGYLFEQFEDAADDSLLGTDPTLQVTVTGNVTIRAIFAEENPTHEVTVAANPSGVASPTGDGTYTNGEVLNLSVPETVVDLPLEHVFQEWTLNGQPFSGVAIASKTFSTLDAPVMDFVAEYETRSYNPEVISLTSLVPTADPVPGGALFGVTLTFDRAMNTGVPPTLTLLSGNATVIPVITGGQWLDNQRWESGTLTFVSDNTGDYTLQVADAVGLDGRTMDPAGVLDFSVDATPPANPVIQIVSLGDGTATIEWNSYVPPPDINNFRIYLEDAAFSTVVPADSLSGVGSGVRQFTFNGLTLDEDHFAAVVAVDVNGNANNSVTPILIRIDSDLPPPVAVSLGIDSPDTATLDWSAYDTSGLIGFDGFMVYREETDFSDVTSLTPVATLPPGETEYKTQVLDRTRTYHFAVVGFNRLGQFDPMVSTASWSDPLSGNFTADLTFGGPGQSAIEILSPLTLLNGSTLTLLPGTTLYFAPGAGISVQDGILNAAGTPLAPIVLTSINDDGTDPLPAPGDWSGVDLLDPVNPSVLEHVWLLYGSGLEVAGANPQVFSLGIVDNAGSGLLVSSGAAFLGSDLYLVYNETGLETVDAGSSATLSGSVILNNASLGARANVDTTITATGNWWGSDDPLDVGALVSGPVDTSAFLLEEPILGVGFGLDAPILQTTNDQVDLLLGAMNAAAFRVSEDSTFTGIPFEDLHPPSATDFINIDPWLETFTLSEGAGTKSVFAEFLSPTGGQVEQLHLDLVLIDEGPSITGWNIDEGDLIERPFVVDATGTSPVGISEVRMEVDGLTVLSTSADALSERWDISGYASGIYRLRLVVEDLSGNLATRSVNVTIDPNPPVAPVISTPVDDTLLTVDIVDLAGFAEPEMNLRVTVNGSVADTGMSDIAGNFTFTAIPLLEGENSIVVSAYDGAGSTSSAPLTIVSDTLSPIAPVMEDPLYDPETGLLIQWRYADADGEQPTRYKVYWDPNPITDVATALGASEVTVEQSWAFVGQPNQNYYFRVVGLDAANNSSVPSNEVTAFFDDTPPVIEVFYDKPMPTGSGDLLITLESNETLKAPPSLTIKPEGRRLPIAVPLTETAPQTWEAIFIVSDASMRSGTAEVLVTARDQDSNLFSGAPVGPDLVVDLTRPTGILRTNVESPVQVLNPRQIELTLELSEPVKVGTVPTLRWSPPSGPEVDIDLSGSQDVWTGLLTLFPEMGKGDGLFLMQATDAVDNTGTLLTDGAVYEIYNTLLPDPPGIPPQLLAQTLPAGEIGLYWEEAYRADTYNVYRIPAEQSGTPNFLVAEGIAETDFVDLPPADGQYRYVVTASRLGAEGSPSPSFTVTSDRTPPPPPENISVSLGVNGVVVSFDPPSGGEIPYRYVLYRNGGPLTVASSSAVDLRDFPPRGVMEYQVASSDVYGNHALTGIASIEMFLGPVKDVEVLVEPGEPVRLSWTETDAITEGFNLYRNGVRQNPTILTNPVYSDPLPQNGLPVTYAITAVNDLGQESAPRQIIVQPATVDFLLNPNDLLEEFDSIAGYFDRYAVTLDNNAGTGSVNLEQLDISRELTSGTTLLRSLDFFHSIPAGGLDGSEVVIPSPREEGPDQIVTMTAVTEPGPGGGVVRYRTTRVLTPAVGRPPAISLAASQPPLAGGLSDFTVQFTNRGRTEADFVLLRDNGDDSGEFSISVFNSDGQEVSVTLVEDFLSGLTFNPDGDGFFRLAPGESRSFTLPDVFVPITLSDVGSAKFVGTLETLFYKTGSSNEQQTGPLTGFMNSGLSETDYYGTSSTDRGIYSNEETITITGQAIDRDSGLPVPEVPLRIGFEVQGFVFYRDVTTDVAGDYSYDFNPTPGVGGEINLWAAHPDVVDQIDQTTIVLYRSFLAPARGNIRMSKNDFIDFEIQLINVGDRDLTSFSITSRAFTVDEEANESDITTLTAALRDPISSPVGARQRVPVKLRLTSALEAPDDAVIEITITSSEGASSTFTAAVSLLPAIPILDVVSPRVGYVDLTVDKGDIVSRQVTITNRGLRPLEDVILTPPQVLPWMQVNLPKQPNGDILLPDLAVGATKTFTVVYTPPEETPVGFYDDFILISGSNAVADYQLNLFAQVGSSESGNVEFFVDNNLVLPIPNASVRLRNVALGIEAGPSLTDANGYVRFDNLQEGKWSWTISAPSHQSRGGTVQVIADQTNGVDVRLGKSLVSIKFSVVPVPFTDRYEIKLEQTFETRVPAPVMVFDPPKFDFETEEPFEIDVILNLTNHGLISVFDVEIQGSTGNRLRITPLIDYLPELRAEQTIEIPAKIVFSGFEQTFSSGSLQGATPQVLGGEYGACTGSPFDSEFLDGIAALAKMNATAGYNCTDGDLGTAAAVALAAASAYKAVQSVNIGKKPAEILINILGTYLGCLNFSSVPGGGGGGSGGGGGHSSSPASSGIGRGCFVAGTPVLMADGSEQAIETLRAGDRLMASGGGSVSIAEAFTLPVHDLVTLSLDDGSLIQSTPEHRIWVDGRGWVPAGELQAGDWLASVGDSFKRVQSVEPQRKSTRVYTFQLEGDSAFFANRILVEDLCGGRNLSPVLLKNLIPHNGRGK